MPDPDIIPLAQACIQGHEEFCTTWILTDGATASGDPTNFQTMLQFPSGSEDSGESLVQEQLAGVRLVRFSPCEIELLLEKDSWGFPVTAAFKLIGIVFRFVRR